MLSRSSKSWEHSKIKSCGVLIIVVTNVDSIMYDVIVGNDFHMTYIVL